MFRNFDKFSSLSQNEGDIERQNNISDDHGEKLLREMMSLSDDQFKSKLRMKKSTFNFICSLVILFFENLFYIRIRFQLKTSVVHIY